MPDRSPIRPGEPRQTLFPLSEPIPRAAARVAALYVRGDSIYKRMENVDAWDQDRDARTFPGDCAAVCHPPCRLWGSMKQFARAHPDERLLAPLAVETVRKCGGVVEHPAASDLWHETGVPRGESRDRWGGFSVSVDQFHFGHPGCKPTRLYIVGCEPASLPPIPFRPGRPEALTCNKWSGPPDDRRVLSRHERERTPPLLASWLVTVARLCRPEQAPIHRGGRNETQVCPVCLGEFVPRKTGRPPLYCNDGCRLIGFRRGKR